MPPFQAALHGAREVGFTVLSMSLSLIAVFIPILLMGGIVGRLFREFAVTLSVAILVSLVVSLTTTPMMCARLLKAPHERRPGRVFLASERAFDAMLRGYAVSLGWALRALAPDDAHPRGHHRPQRVPVRAHSEGLLPAAGHRAHDRLDPGRPGHFLPGDAAEARRLRRDRQRRPGGRERGRLHRRRPAQLRLHVHHAQTAEGAQGERRPGDRAPAPEARAASPARTCSSCRCRTSASAGGRRTRSTSSRCRRTISRTCACGSRACAGRSRSCRSSPTSTPTSRTRACRRRWSSTARPRRAWGSPRA